MNWWHEALPQRCVAPVVHRAKWLVCGDRPALENGALVACDGRIAALGRWPEISRGMPPGAAVVDHGAAALIPALVNAHTHLEWSLLEGCVPFPQAGFPAWLKLIFEHRADLDGNALKRALARGWEKMSREPVVLFADLTGSLAEQQRASCTSSPRKDTGESGGAAVPLRQPFFEVLGFDVDDLETVVPEWLLHDVTTVAELERAALAAHAPYSTAPALIRGAKRWDERRRRPFSIHVAEHPQEVEFVRAGTGFCRELLEQIGRWNPRWPIPGMSPVAYLDDLGVLDSRTLLVHAVHLEPSDWDRVAQRGCSVCFCPRSNHNLNVGRPAVGEALARGINAALGTDSLASNTDLDLFREAFWLLERDPGIAPDQAFFMITAGAARALGADGWCGTLAVGRTARLLTVDLSGESSRADLSASIIARGKAGAWQWA